MARHRHARRRRGDRERLLMARQSAPLFVVALALSGCGGPELPPPVDTEEAGQQLRTALESWKKGEPYKGLESRDPPIVINEPLWRDGTKLLNYELEKVELHGRQGR